mmetsp:Transcript_108441/g.288647  ORF Transcript_108441/g.288647 Transcript_108441/m.288647 type:complete len:489 (+) Transcript_108441:1254-2720(+)
MHAALQRDARATVATHVATGRGVERQASANGRVHGVLFAAQEVARVQAQVESHGDVELQLVNAPVQERELGQVRGTEGRRAGSVRHEVGPSQVEDEAEAVGDDGLHVGAALSLWALGDPVPVVLVKADRATAMVGISVRDLLGDAHLEEILRTAVQHHPLHRVHDPGLVEDDLEELVVKQLNALHHGLMLRRTLPRHERVVVGVVVVLEVPSRVGDLHTGIAAAVETGVVGACLVVVAHEARRHVHHLELLANRPRRTLAGEEERRIALPVEEGERGGLLQEGGGQGERLLIAPALVVEHLWPEDEDRVWLRLDLDVVLLDRHGGGRTLTGGLQDHGGVLGAHEVHDLHELPPPDAQELTQAGIIGVLRRILGLLVVSEREAHECRSPLIDLLAEHISTVGLDEGSDLGDEGVVLVEQGVLWRVLVRRVDPCHLATVVRAQVALLHLLCKALQLSSLCHVLHGLHCLPDLVKALAHPHHAEALLEKAS